MTPAAHPTKLRAAGPGSCALAAGWAVAGHDPGVYGSADRGPDLDQAARPSWQDDRVDELLLRWVEPDKLFVTTPGRRLCPLRGHIP